MKEWAIAITLTVSIVYPAYASTSEIPIEGITAQFENEPTINEIQTAAIKYAEVQPKKIQRWRKEAAMKALMPKVSLDLDRSVSNTYEIYTSSSIGYTVLGPDDKTTKWGISFAWDLGELIWNDDQTNIDVRSKLMVQLRNDVLEEVTKLYFERRKLQADLVLNPPQDPKEKVKMDIRLQELTANIDALTGGYLSREISKIAKD